MIHARMKALFFDTKAVKNAVDAATRRVLGRFGALVRKTARASIREAAGSAPAGSPPHSHMAARRRRINRRRKAAGKEPIRGGFQGLRHILYAYEPAKRSVVIGPASNRTRSMTIPEILEYGERDPKVKARPYMGPAFAKEKPKLSALWAGSVKQK